MSESYLSDRVKDMPESLLWKFFSLARQTPGVISLSVGEPDFPTPWHISEEGIYAIEKGRTYYPPSKGLEQLRKGIPEYYRRRFGTEGYETENVHWTYERPFEYDGRDKSISLCNMPNSIGVRYRDNKASAIGTYTAKAYLTYDSDNYNEPDIDTTIDWAIVFKVTVLPVPVAPEIKPCLFASWGYR